MKKPLFLILLCAASAIAQQTVESSLKNAKRYLADDPCNTTGLLYAKGALKLEPNNLEAHRLIDACDKVKFQKGKTLFENGDFGFKTQKIFESLHDKYPNSEELNYILAKIYLENSGGNHVSKKYISNSIEANPRKIDYRWIRVRCNMLSNSTILNFEQVIEDITFMIENGEESGKLYAYLSYAFRQVGIHYHGKNVTRNKGWSDDNSAQEAEMAFNKKEALKHYRLALEAAQKAIAIDSTYQSKVQVSGIKNNIADLKR